MNTRKDLRTGDAEYRATNHAPRPRPATPPRRSRLVPLLIVAAAAAVSAVTYTAHAQDRSDIEALAVQEDRGWHGIGRDLQAQATTVDVRGSMVGVWVRSPVGNQYGQWLHVKYVLDCIKGDSLMYAVIDGGRVQTLREITGGPGILETPQPGTPARHMMQQLCAEIGYPL